VGPLGHLRGVDAGQPARLLQAIEQRLAIEVATVVIGLHLAEHGVERRALALQIGVSRSSRRRGAAGATRTMVFNQRHNDKAMQQDQ
jgi:hypothetical protein